MKRNALFLVAALGPLVGGCGSDESRFFVGTWRGESGGTSLTLQVSEEVADAVGTRLRGTVSSGKLACLNAGPLSGTVANKTVTLAAQGSGRRSGLTLVDIVGELSDTRIVGTLTMSGDNQNEEMCDFDKTPIVLQK